jgi:hypothetical protein
MVLFGGEDSSGTPQADMFAWNGANWSTTQRMAIWPEARQGHILANVPDGLLLFGGADINGNPFGDTWLWIGGTWVPQNYSDASAPPSARAYATAAAWGQSVVLFGGEDANYNFLNETWIWDGSVWMEAQPPQNPQNQPVARISATMATLGGQVVLFGGLDSSYNPLGDTWIWSGDGGAWTAGPPGPPARDGATMTTF